MMTSWIIIAVVAIGCAILVVKRRRPFAEDGGLGYVSQSWLAEFRASEGWLGR
jgi:hypothetical protein